MGTAVHETKKLRSRFAIWAWSPIIVLRVALVITYLLYVYASVIAFIAGVPLFSLTTFPGFTTAWAVLMGTSAVISAIGATTDRWQKLEKWASLVLFSTMLAYVIGMNLVGFVEGDLGRQFAGAVAVVAMVLPTTRFVYLAAQSGKKHAEPIDSGK